MFLGQMTKTALFLNEKMLKGTLQDGFYRDRVKPYYDIACKATTKMNQETGRIEKDYQWSHDNEVLTPGKGSNETGTKISYLLEIFIWMKTYE